MYNYIIYFLIALVSFYILFVYPVRNQLQLEYSFVDRKYNFHKPVDNFIPNQVITVNTKDMTNIIRPKKTGISGICKSDFALLPEIKEPSIDKTIIDELYNYIFEPDDIQFYLDQQNNKETVDNLNLLWEHPETLDIDDTLIEAGSQNTHDSFVQRVTKQTAKEYLSDSALELIPIKFIEISNGISKTNLSDLQKHDAQKTLDVIRTRNSRIYNIDKTETEVLVGVWEKSLLDDNIKTQFFIELSDCVENSEVVCATGVTSRLINALNINHPENMPKTKELLRAEMLQTASKIYTEMNTDPNYKNVITETLKKEYSGILTEPEIDIEISTWIDHI